MGTECNSNQTFNAHKGRKCILTCQELPSVRLGEGGGTWRRLEFMSEWNSGESGAGQSDRGCSQQSAEGAAECGRHARSDTRHAPFVAALRMTALFACQGGLLLP